MLAAALLVGTGHSYTQESDALAALRDGEITIWVVGAERPQTALEAIVEAHHATPLVYRGQTAGSFGQVASTFGTSASDYGLPSDTAAIAAPHSVAGADAPAAPSPNAGYHEEESGGFGQVASNYGTESSNHGQTASSLGQTAGSYGTEASNHGQPAGGFGNSLSTIADAGSALPASATVPSAGGSTKHLSPQLLEDFPDLHVTYVNVAANDLKPKLEEAEGTADYPDLLIGVGSPVLWDGLRRQFGVPMLLADVTVDGGSAPAGAVQFEILSQAPHMEAARALALWLNEASAGCAGCVLRSIPDGARPAAAMAVATIRSLLQGNNFSDQDPTMAKFPSQLGKDLLRTTGDGVADSGVRVEVVRAAVQGRLAAVSLRVVASAERVFGAVHPLVVLRRGDDGHWRVLHVSLSLSPEEQSFDQGLLMDDRPLTPQERRDGVLGVSLAAPPDGDTRKPMPELWWDNTGGARLQVVEWQRQADGGWSDARLEMVPDRNARLQTRVTAGFAKSAGLYRWRVWSVGMNGEMKITPWRTFKIL